MSHSQQLRRGSSSLFMFMFCSLRVFRRRRRRRSSPGAPRRCYYRRSVANFSGPEWGKVSTDRCGSWRGGEICHCLANSSKCPSTDFTRIKSICASEKKYNLPSRSSQEYLMFKICYSKRGSNARQWCERRKKLGHWVTTTHIP